MSVCAGTGIVDCVEYRVWSKSHASVHTTHRIDFGIEDVGRELVRTLVSKPRFLVLRMIGSSTLVAISQICQFVFRFRRDVP